MVTQISFWTVSNGVILSSLAPTKWVFGVREADQSLGDRETLCWGHSASIHFCQKQKSLENKQIQIGNPCTYDNTSSATDHWLLTHRFLTHPPLPFFLYSLSLRFRYLHGIRAHRYQHGNPQPSRRLTSLGGLPLPIPLWSSAHSQSPLTSLRIERDWRPTLRKQTNIVRKKISYSRLSSV